MSELINEPPDGKEFKRWVMMYLGKSYKESDKGQLLKFFGGSDFNVQKSGQWGKEWGYADAQLYMKTNPDFVEEISDAQREKIIKIANNVIKGTEYGIEISALEVIPRFTDSVPSLEQNIEQILAANPERTAEFELPNDLIQKAREMSEIYTYIYFIENSLRIFIQNVQADNAIQIPRRVQTTIDKHKEQEAANKFLPLRGNSDLFYCDFVQLGQIISGNWEVFKRFFPNKDEHWLRVKIEDLYSVRCLVAHCGYVGEEEKNMVKTYFNVILKQLK